MQCDFIQTSLHHHLLFAKSCNCRKPYLLQPERKNICKSWDTSFSSSSFPGRVYAVGLGTAGGGLGGTVAVVSPALSRQSHPQTKVRRREGERTSAAPSLPPSPFQGKMESCFRLHRQQPQCLPRKRPRLATWLLSQFRWGLMTATVGKVFRMEGRLFGLIELFLR